jgi:hypothetical protein
MGLFEVDLQIERPFRSTALEEWDELVKHIRAESDV